MQGFPLIKLNLIVLFFVSLFAIYLYFANPAEFQAKVNNDKRARDVNIIANAILSYSLENEGEISEIIDVKEEDISSDGIDLCKLLIPDYIVALPRDPALDSQDVTSCARFYSINYLVTRNLDDSITVSAPHTEIPPAKSIIKAKRKIK